MGKRFSDMFFKELNVRIQRFERLIYSIIYDVVVVVVMNMKMMMMMVIIIKLHNIFTFKF